MILVIDPQVAGISGDMLMCSLVDMGSSKDKIIRGIKEGAGISGMKFSKVSRCGMSATGLQISISEDCSERPGSEVRSSIVQAAGKAGLSKAASKFAADSIDILISAEARIHGRDKDKVLLHEAGSADTIVDIIGTAIALEDLGLYGDKAFCCPVSVGSGTASFSHGAISNPSPAVLEILKGTGIAISGRDAGELATPTGVSMLAALRPAFISHYPAMKIEQTGYGAGTREYDGFANVLKTVRGQAAAGEPVAGAVLRDIKHKGSAAADSICVLETNVDDATGEMLGAAIRRMTDAGALDVAVVAGTGKKGRPANIITAICKAESAAALTRILMDETGTRGVRIRQSERIVAGREYKTADIALDGQEFSVRYKTGINSDYFKIESDDIQRVAEATGQPFKNAEALIKNEIQNGPD